MPKLLLKFNAAVIKEVAFDKPSLTVGRKDDNDIVIDNPAISGHHCRLTLEGGGYYIEDLESTNGTFVNEKKIKKSGLHHNDVVGLAKHALVFLNEAELAAAGGGPDAGSDKTMVLTPQKQAELIAASAAAAKPAGPEKIGWLRVLKGAADGTSEFELKGMSTYIGKSDRVQIQIKGSGLFGSAPEVAASVHRKPEGFVLVAVTEGYPVVNGAKVSGSVVLREGDMIDCGATTMVFELR
ncbi:MAG: FHA domain-containing protein [Elusimicrobiota bacterium]|nr:MAG: FHA domain-containing protein [Elusimicrobiota bacterium]